MSKVQVLSSAVETRVHGSANGCGTKRTVCCRSAVLSVVLLCHAARLHAAEESRLPEPAPPVTASQNKGSDLQGAPPEVQAADPKWNERDQPSSAELEPADSDGASDVTVALGAQVFGVSGKVMSGLTLRIGSELFWGELEFSPVWLTQASPEFDGHLLGNQWGFYFSLAPLRTRYVEVLVGLGADVYHLWEIHGDEVQAALALRGQGHFRVTEHASVFVNLRSYALHSGGLELGVRRDGSRSVPLLAAVGAEWRFE